MNDRLSDDPDRLNYQEALRWLMGRINYERTLAIPYHERQLKLDRMRQLLNRLGNPDAGMKIIHVAGTKGKGSTGAMVASILRSAGFRVGVFSSPHLHRVEERFVVDDIPCRSRDFVDLINHLQPVVKQLDEQTYSADELTPGPTYFDVTNALAIQHFADRKVDFAVLEVGLGGRLDSTNVCMPIVSVITSISRDHTKQLGNSLVSIAREKAGIIKHGVPVISGVTTSGPRDVIVQAAREHGCRFLELDRQFEFRYQAALDPQPHGLMDFSFHAEGVGFELHDARLALLGKHQAMNAAVAVATTVELRRQGWHIRNDDIRKGLATARLPARIEQIGNEPTVILDTAHNSASVQALTDTLEEYFQPARRHLLFAVSQDKDVREIVSILAPCFDQFIATQYRQNLRVLPAKRLAAIVTEELQRIGHEEIPVQAFDHPVTAWEYLLEKVAPDELVAITGSFFIAAEMRMLLLGKNTCQREPIL
jgi:dihydrofolate synthase/folylpolyglutamate synthase